MSFYTVILDYDGGTYISQVRARNEKLALSLWAKALDVSAIPSLGLARKRTLIQELRQSQRENDSLVAVDTLKNVWCASPTIGGKLALIHIVKAASR